METLTPLDTLFDASAGTAVTLPAELARLYGDLRFPRTTSRPCVIGNFVTTLDGVVSLNVPGRSGGGEISGFSDRDRMVMGLLRAVSDAVIVGAGTLRAVPKHLWIPENTFKPLAGAYQQLRKNIGKKGQPLTVILTESGDLDASLPVFNRPDVPTLVVTNREGLIKLRERPLASHVQVEAVAGAQPANVGAILEAVGRIHQCDTILTEGGPKVIGKFLAEHLLDELFLTLAPQIAGRRQGNDRPGLVDGQEFAPDHPLWSKLVSVKRGGDHLFLRYSFR